MLDFLADPLVEPSWLAAHLADDDLRVVDTRPVEQYAGEAIWTPHGSLFLPSGQSWIALPDGRIMRGGHIPGAVHLHASWLLNPVDWTYLPRESLRALARGAGLEPEQRVITYCGSGISASASALCPAPGWLPGHRALRRLLGRMGHGTGLSRRAGTGVTGMPLRKQRAKTGDVT